MLADKPTPFHQILILDDNKINKPPEVTKTVHANFDNIDYKLWNGEEIRDFIRNNFDDSVLWSYDTLKPYAFKADLARYCILYKLGGWYSDINNEFVKKIDYHKEYNFIFFTDILKNSGFNFAVSNGLIYSVPANPVFLQAIKKIFFNCSNNYYGPNSLYVTGPVVFGEAIKRYTPSGTKYLQGELVEDSSEKRQAKYTIPNNNIICLNKSNKKLPGGVIGIEGSNNYNILWESKTIYQNLDGEK